MENVALRWSLGLCRSGFYKHVAPLALADAAVNAPPRMKDFLLTSPPPLQSAASPT